MVLTLFGGSGATGRQVVLQALAQGVRVRLLVRPGHGAALAAAGVEVVEGELHNSAAVLSVMQGSDAVCCVIGARPPYSDIFCAAATRTIMAAMQQAGVSRLVCQTGAMVGDYPENRTLPFRWMTALANRRMPELMRDRLEQEQLVRDSGLQWTLVKPPRLTDVAAGGSCRAGAGLKVGLLSSISRQSLAGFIVAELLAPHHIGAAVFVSD